MSSGGRSFSGVFLTKTPVIMGEHRLAHSTVPRRGGASGSHAASADNPVLLAVSAFELTADEVQFIPENHDVALGARDQQRKGVGYVHSPGRQVPRCAVLELDQHFAALVAGAVATDHDLDVGVDGMAGVSPGAGAAAAAAINYLKLALELEPGHAYTWLQLGNCQVTLGLAGVPRGRLERALELQPAYTAARQALDALAGSPLAWLRGLWRRWRRR